MPEKEMWDIYQMVNNVILQMDAAENRDNEELFEKIRWALQELEHKLITISNEFSSMKEAFLKFAEAYNSVQEEINFKYNKPQNS